MDTTQRRLLAYLRPHVRTLTGGLLCAAIASAISASIFKFIASVIDLMGQGDLSQLNRLCFFILAVFLLKGLFSFGQTYLLALVANRIATQLRDDCFSHLQGMSLSYFHRRRTGAIMSVLTSDVGVLQNAALNLKDAASAPITIVFSLVVLFRLSWRLTLVALVCVPIMAWVISRISRRIRRIAVQVQERHAEVSTTMQETLTGVRIIQSFAAEEHVIARFRQQNTATLKAIMRGVRRSSQLRPILELIGATGIALVLYLGGLQVAQTARYHQKHDAAYREQWQRSHPDEKPPVNLAAPTPAGMLTTGGLVGFLYVLDLLARAVGDVGSLASLRNQALVSAKRIFDEIADVPSDIQELPDALPMSTPMQAHIRFENVSFRYQAESDDVLRDVNFEVKPGEVVALVGRSGAGKSTLVDLIPRFYDPTQGRILIDGLDVRTVQIASLRRQIGIVPQETWLFAGTLRDNIAYGRRDATDAEISTAAYAANAAFVEGMPEKLDTVVGERGIRLSGGERQRIAIARAILMNPRLLILDEATSSLDASSEELVQKALDELMRGRTTLVIAHRLSTIINADRILAMQDGRIVEMGSHRELIARGGYYARLYETQLRGFE